MSYLLISSEIRLVEEDDYEEEEEKAVVVVVGWWVVLMFPMSLWGELFIDFQCNLPMEKNWLPTDGRTDRRTDPPSYARTHLKMII